MTLRGLMMTVSGRALPKNHASEVIFRKRNIRRDKKFERQGRLSVRDITARSFYVAQESAKTLMTYKYLDRQTRIRHTQQKVGRVIMIAAQKDRLVNTKKSAEWLANDLNTEVIYATDATQPKRYHTGLPAYPAFYRQTVDTLISGQDIPIVSPENPDAPYSLLTPR